MEPAAAQPSAGARWTAGTPVTALPGVGPRRAQALARLGIRTLGDLLRHVPVRHEKHAGLVPIRDLVRDEEAQVLGTVAKRRWVGGPGPRGRFEVVLEDGTGTLHLSFFNARWMDEQVRAGADMWVQGKVKLFQGARQMANPKYRLGGKAGDTAEGAAGERLRPVYPATEGMPSEAIEELTRAAVEALAGQLPDPVPAALLAHHGMPGLGAAYRLLHAPTTPDEAAAGRRRLAWNELLLLQLAVALRRSVGRRAHGAPPLPLTDAQHAGILARFPFALTPAQERAVGELRHDLAQGEPMNRLLQGDVGAGKTVVALYAMLAAVANGRQALLMAPTEVLAEQHAAAIGRMLEGSGVRTALLTGGTSAAGSKARQRLRAAVQAGEVDLLVGTQALVGPDLAFKDLAVAVIDEQHRFGVHQRAAFKVRPEAQPDAAGRRPAPHHLVMTATPIPRTLAVTLFGDLDLSVLDGLPPGRIPVKTTCVPPSMAPQVYAHVRQRLERGGRAFVVVPAVEEGDASGPAQEAGDDPLKAVSSHAAFLRGGPLAGFEVAEVHGQMKRTEREEAMARFRSGDAQVLVATTVIEVGVDVPEASCIVIEHAERFGLSQLHQLRGRVGRGPGEAPSCILVADTTTEEAAARMDAITATNDGFKIAEKDFELRGMGRLLGTSQHGADGLRVAMLPRDLPLLNLARQDAGAIVAEDPILGTPRWKLLRAVLMRAHGEGLGLVDVG